MRITQPGRYRRESDKTRTTAIEELLDRQNLLGRRSALAREQDSVFVSPEAIEELESKPWLTGGGQVPEVSDDDPLNPALVRNPYNLLLTDQLSRKADDYFEVGVACFRVGDFRRAGNYFELDKKIKSELPRSYLATMLVAFERKNMNEAGINLRFAFRRLKTLDDMKLDIDSLYKDRRLFERTLGAARLLVTRAPDDAVANLFLGYLAWLDGDLPVARSSIQIAVRNMSDANTVEHVAEFGRLIGATVAAPTAEGE